MPDEFVYILSHYGEYGAENIHVTLRRRNVIDLFHKHWQDYDKAEALLGKIMDDYSDEALAEKCRKEDGLNLTMGWGGPQLHVAKIDT